MSPHRKAVAITQSNYIPWKGYFDVIKLVDEFILLDDVQYTRRDWRNRNRIKTSDGSRWLTIPVAHGGPRERQMIADTRVSDPRWGMRHWSTLTHWYASAPHFRDYRYRFEELYLGSRDTRLSETNRSFILAICDVLGIETPIRRSTDYEASGSRTERLVNLCGAAGATRYLSGPVARAYLDESMFAEAGIELAWMDYSGYPEYAQLYPPFDHAVTVLDLIFNTGAAATRYMKSGSGRVLRA